MATPTVPPRLLPIFQGMIESHHLFGGDLSWILGWAYQESRLDPWAIRYEPAFYARYTQPLDLSPTEEHARALSWGLFQIMGQVARENGYGGEYLAGLCDPETNAKLAARLILQRKHQTDGTWEGALAAYNGGLRGNRSRPYRRQEYVDDVTDRREMFLGGGICHEP